MTEEVSLDNTTGMLADSDAALRYMFAGNATFTLRSRRTQERRTYKVRRAEQEDSQRASAYLSPTYFVALLTGPENSSDFSYIGVVQDGKFRLTRKSKLNAQALPVRAFVWTLAQLHAGRQLPAELEIWHSGTCGRCGRKLTVPESVASGLGPECAAK